MKIGRAIGISIITYIVSFIFGILIGLAFGFDFSGGQQIPAGVWILGIVTSVFIMWFFTWWYFQNIKIKRNHVEGFKFGITAVIVGFVIDAILIIPLFFMENVSQTLDYYFSPFFWMTLLVIVLTSMVVGHIMEKEMKK